MGMDLWWEVPDEKGAIREFRTLDEALEFAERVGRETGEYVPIERKCGVPEEDL